MEPNHKPPTRKAHQLRVPVLPEEALEIRRLASTAGLPVAAYLRSVALGYRLHSMLDHRRVEELARINGDLGRLGGLLELWLADDARTARFDVPTILAVLSKIEDTQHELQRVMRGVVLATASRQHL